MMNDFCSDGFLSPLKKYHLEAILIGLYLVLVIGCSSSSESLNNGSYMEVPSIVINVQAEYSLKDSVWRAKGDMIKQLSIIDLIGDDTRIFKKGVPDENYTKTVTFYIEQGTWNIELIDYKGLMRDTSVSYPQFGEYTVRFPIILDNISPFEISEYLNTLGEGRVIIDKIAN